MIKERFNRKNSQPNCFFLLYYPVLDGSLTSIWEKIFKNKNLFLDFIIQTITSIDILRKKNYSQNDLNPNNLMFKKKGKKYQWYIIDYGNVIHKDYPQSQLDKDTMYLELYGQDLLMFIRGCVNFNLFKFIKDNNLKVGPFRDSITNLQKEKTYYNKILKYIPKPVKKEKFFGVFTYLVAVILFPQIFLKCSGIPKSVYSKYKNKLPYPEIFLYCLKHYNDQSYGKIIEKIKNVYS